MPLQPEEIQHRLGVQLDETMVAVPMAADPPHRELQLDHLNHVKDPLREALRMDAMFPIAGTPQDNFPELTRV